MMYYSDQIIIEEEKKRRLALRAETAAEEAEADAEPAIQVRQKKRSIEPSTEAGYAD